MPEDFLDQSYGGMGDYVTLMNLYDEVEQEIDVLREYDYEAAHWEREYRMRMSIRTAQERMGGTPVTIIDNLLRGEDDIAVYREKWKRAEANSKASNQVIWLKKDKMEMLKELIKHEWYRPSNS